MTFALQTLNIILEEEGGVVINKNMANYLLSRLEECQDMEQCFVMDYLLKYKPKSTEVRLKMLNELDPYLGTGHSGPVVLAAAKLFYKIMIANDDTKSLSADFVDRFQPQLGKILKGIIYVIGVALSHIQDFFVFDRIS